VNLCWRNSAYSLNCNVGVMLVFRMFCRITQSSEAHRTESVSGSSHFWINTNTYKNSSKPSQHTYTPVVDFSTREFLLWQNINKMTGYYACRQCYRTNSLLDVPLLYHDCGQVVHIHASLSSSNIV